jgi:hypothetical protein
MFLALSIAESGSISIGEYGPLTQDRAERHGRYYSDKAPGMAFLALPVVMSARPPLARRGGEACAGPGCWFQPNGQTNPHYNALYYLSTVWASVAITAAGVVLFRSFAIDLYGDRGAATFAALVLAFGTPLGAWATMFFEHAAAASWLFAGLVAAHWAGRQPSASPVIVGVLVAAPLGLALVTSYLATVPVLLVAAYALLCAWHQPRRWALSAALAAMATGALVVAPRPAGLQLGRVQIAVLGRLRPRRRLRGHEAGPLRHLVARADRLARRDDRAVSRLVVGRADRDPVSARAPGDAARAPVPCARRAQRGGDSGTICWSTAAMPIGTAGSRSALAT